MFFLTILAFSLIILTSYILITSIEKINYNSEKDHLSSQVIILSELLKDRYGEAPINLENADLKKLHTQLSENLGSHIFFIQKDGTSIFYEDSEIPYNFNFSEPVSFQSVYKNQQHYVVALTKLNDSTENQLWYIASERPYNLAFADINQLKTIVISCITLLLLLLWYLGKRLSFKIQKPIQALAADAEKIANGDINQKIETSESGELAHIADSFNLILDHLKSTMQQVLAHSGKAASLEDIMAYVEGNHEKLVSGIISINRADTITSFNHAAEEITGISSDEILGIDIKNPIPAGIKPLILDLRRCLSSGRLQLKRISNIENTLGEKIAIQYSITIEFGLNNEVLGAICVFKRIEDIEKFEASATRAKNLEALGEIAAGMAHEIKNPLTSIRGYAQFINLDLAEKGKTSEEMAIILQEVDRLSGMLDEFLKFARPKTPVLVPQDMAELAQYVLNLRKTDLPEYIKLNSDLKPVPKVLADKELFTALLLNLILNAEQAMPQSGEITVKTWYDKSRNVVCIQVIDNGPGIQTDILEKIFQPFFTTKSSGTGMGLAISSRIIEAHKGVMEIESITNEMTKFTILLQPCSNQGEFI